MLRGFDILELQADALCAFIGSKRSTVWLFATIEVWSRLWAGSVLGRRYSRNATTVLNDVILRGRVVGVPLIATDGFEYYVGVIACLFGSACVYGQVLKLQRNDRVVRVERRVKDRFGESVEGRAVGVGGFRNPEHLVRRAPQPHDSPRLGVLAPSLARPRPWRRPAPRARRPLALPLPFHPAAQGVAVRSRDPDARDAGRLGERANELERHLHGAGPSVRNSCGGRAHSRDRPAHRNWHSRTTDVLVAARTTNCGLINSDWRKHPRVTDQMSTRSSRRTRDDC